jgi:hypothetical protein
MSAVVLRKSRHCRKQNRRRKPLRRLTKQLARREGLPSPLRGSVRLVAPRPGDEPPTPRFEVGVWGPERPLERREVSFSCPLVPF